MVLNQHRRLTPKTLGFINKRTELTVILCSLNNIRLSQVTLLRDDSTSRNSSWHDVRALATQAPHIASTVDEEVVDTFAEPQFTNTQSLYEVNAKRIYVYALLI